jgi:sensor histidine kinase regulating citrate/malate metabolism
MKKIPRRHQMALGARPPQRRGHDRGLYIVQRLLEQLGGDVAVASAPGRSITFTVTLPLRAPLSLSA